MRYVGDKIVSRIETNEFAEQVADVNFIPRQMATDGVCIYREPHRYS